jgi:hypothetical protein
MEALNDDTIDEIDTCDSPTSLTAQTGSADSNVTKDEPNDSPAFRLRPRRSTPRTCESSVNSTSPSVSKRYTVFRPEMTDRKLRYSMAKAAKRTLFTPSDSISAANRPDNLIAKIIGTSVVIDEPDDESQDSIEFIQRMLNSKQTTSTPTPVVLNDVELGVFAEQLRLRDLCQDDVQTAGYYLSLRIVHVCSSTESIQVDRPSRVLFDSSHSLNQVCPETSAPTPTIDAPTHDFKSVDKASVDGDDRIDKLRDPSITQENLNESSGNAALTSVDLSKDASVRLLVQEMDRTIMAGSLWKPRFPLLLVHLHGPYADCVDQLRPGKILELVRFDFERVDPDQLHYEHLGQRMHFWPFVLHMRSQTCEPWLPLASIRDHLEPFDESNLLVKNGQTNVKSQTTADETTDSNATGSDRKEAMRFSSYVVKIADSEQTISLQQTKSPTIKRFMKTINRAAIVSDKSPIKIKIKRSLS